MHDGALQPRSLGAAAGPSSVRWIDHDPYGTQHFLVGESLVLCYPAESSLLGPAHDRHERSGETGRRKGLARDNPDSGDLPRRSSRDDRLLTANDKPTDSPNGGIRPACTARKAIRSA